MAAVMSREKTGVDQLPDEDQSSSLSSSSSCVGTSPASGASSSSTSSSSASASIRGATTAAMSMSYSSPSDSATEAVPSGSLTSDRCTLSPMLNACMSISMYSGMLAGRQS